MLTFPDPCTFDVMESLRRYRECDRPDLLRDLADYAAKRLRFSEAETLHASDVRALHALAMKLGTILQDVPTTNEVNAWIASKPLDAPRAA